MLSSGRKGRVCLNLYTCPWLVHEAPDWTESEIWNSDLQIELTPRPSVQKLHTVKLPIFSVLLACNSGVLRAVRGTLKFWGCAGKITPNQRILNWIWGLQIATERALTSCLSASRRFDELRFSNRLKPRDRLKPRYLRYIIFIKVFYKNNILDIFFSTYRLGRVRLQLQIESGGFRTELIWSLNLIWRFLIWSSSRSATASNSHALPYIVVELELLASDQPVAFFYRSIVKLNLELCSCARLPIHHAPTATALTNDGITTAAAGPIQCPLFNSFYRHLDLIR